MDMALAHPRPWTECVSLFSWVFPGGWRAVSILRVSIYLVSTHWEVPVVLGWTASRRLDQECSLRVPEMLSESFPSLLPLSLAVPFPEQFGTISPSCLCFTSQMASSLQLSVGNFFFLEERVEGVMIPSSTIRMDPWKKRGWDINESLRCWVGTAENHGFSKQPTLL